MVDQGEKHHAKEKEVDCQKGGSVSVKVVEQVSERAKIHPVGGKSV